MRTTIWVIALFAILCVTAAGGYRVIGPERFSELEYYHEQIGALTQRLYDAKLHHIALFMEAASKGTHRLVLGAGASARAETPLVEEAERADRPEPVALIAVYPASSPLHAGLPGVGECDLLGAVALRVEATAAEGDDAEKTTTAKPDIYLLAYGTNGRWAGDARLVSLAVDDEGRLRFQQVLATPAQRSETSRIAGRLPGVIIKLADQGEDAADKSARRATVQLTWLEGTYRFALDLLAEGAKP